MGVAFLAVFLLFAAQAPGFLTWTNLLATARQYAEVLLVSVGMTGVILIGGIDLSVGSVAGVAGLVAGGAALRYGGASAVLAGLAVGLVLGGVNGALIAGLRLSPVIVTLGMWAGARSLAYLLTHGEPLSGLPDGFTAWGDTWIAGWIPLTVALAAVVAGAASVALRRTAYGRGLVAQGQNEKAARFSGIAVGLQGASVYLFTGLFAGAAGLLIAARTQAAVPDAGMGLEFEAITAVVLGGARIEGGYASVVGTTLGVATLGLLHNGFNLLGYDSAWQTLAVGGLLLGAVILDSRLRSVAG